MAASLHPHVVVRPPTAPATGAADVDLPDFDGPRPWAGTRRGR